MAQRSIFRTLLVPLLIGVGLMIWLLLRNGSDVAPEDVSSPPAAPSMELEPPPIRPSPTPASTPSASPAPATPAPSSPVPLVRAAPVAPAVPVPDAIHTEIESVGTMIRDYRNAVGGNPVGTNAEITKALLGDNEKQVKFELPPGASLSGEGELVDRWGTPFFFHQLSGTQMEIRSAGPDRKLWTEDDVQGR